MADADVHEIHAGRGNLNENMSWCCDGLRMFDDFHDIGVTNAVHDDCFHLQSFLDCSFQN